MLDYAIIDGTKIKNGDWVGFKSDTEQYGKVVEIKRGRYSTILVLENEYGFDGDYIGGDTRTTMNADECWVD